MSTFGRRLLLAPISDDWADRQLETAIKEFVRVHGFRPDLSDIKIELDSIIHDLSDLNPTVGQRAAYSSLPNVSGQDAPDRRELPSYVSPSGTDPMGSELEETDGP